MARPARIRFPVAAAFAALVAATGCVDLAGADYPQHVERDEKRFRTQGKPEVVLTTFDGAIEVRSWDRREVQVVIERRAATKEAADTIEVVADQQGDRVVVEAKVPARHGFGLWHNRSAKLIVSMPAAADLNARSGDGAIDVEGIDGTVTIRSGDGGIYGRRLQGEIDVHTGDGSIRLADVNGTLNAITGDGGIVAAGTFTSLHARSGDGSVNISAEPGSAAKTPWNITTGDGSVTLALPAGFDADLDAHTGDGRIRVQDIEVTNVTGRIGRDTVRGRIGDGGGSLRVRTGDGSIVLKRSSAPTT